MNCLLVAGLRANEEVENLIFEKFFFVSAADYLYLKLRADESKKGCDTNPFKPTVSTWRLAMRT